MSLYGGKESSVYKNINKNNYKMTELSAPINALSFGTVFL